MRRNYLWFKLKGNSFNELLLLQVIIQRSNNILFILCITIHYFKESGLRQEEMIISFCQSLFPLKIEAW